MGVGYGFSFMFFATGLSPVAARASVVGRLEIPNRARLIGLYFGRDRAMCAPNPEIDP
jgi:hypothetical protein